MEILKCQMTYSSLYEWVILIFELEPIFKTNLTGRRVTGDKRELKKSIWYNYLNVNTE